MKQSDTEAMQRCLNLAKEAVDAGDNPFGAVIVDAEGSIVAEGRNRENTQLDVTLHAEIDAIRQATSARGENCLRGLTLYTNGQPCLMCSVAIRRVGISRVVYGAPSGQPSRVSPHPLTDPDFGQSPPPSVESGLLAEESRKIQGRL